MQWRFDTYDDWENDDQIYLEVAKLIKGLLWFTDERDGIYRSVLQKRFVVIRFVTTKNGNGMGRSVVPKEAPE